MTKGKGGKKQYENEPENGNEIDLQLSWFS